MTDPFAVGHRAKAIADAKEAEAKAKEEMIQRATARGEATKTPAPIERPYMPRRFGE